MHADAVHYPLLLPPLQAPQVLPKRALLRELEQVQVQQQALLAQREPERWPQVRGRLQALPMQPLHRWLQASGSASLQ